MMVMMIDWIEHTKNLKWRYSSGGDSGDKGGQKEDHREQLNIHTNKHKNPASNIRHQHHLG